MKLKFSNGDTAVPVFSAVAGSMFVVQQPDKTWRPYVMRWAKDEGGGFLVVVAMSDPCPTKQAAQDALHKAAGLD